MLRSAYLPEAPHHLGYKYKKVVYVEYTDGSFTQRKSPANKLLGPLLRGKVNDQFHVSKPMTGEQMFTVFHLKSTTDATTESFQQFIEILAFFFFTISDYI